MGSTRFFLSDLPNRTTEQDLNALFRDYGRVQRVELKTKEQFADSDQTTAKVIAFVTVETEDANYCLNELNWQRLHGAKLKVSLAKESFLDRLKREREEQEHSQDQAQEQSQFNQSSSRLLENNTQNKRRVFGENEEINDDEVAPELLITKKRAANSLQNGKIVIQQEFDVKPLHVIEQHKKHVKNKQQLDEKASIADLKRKESLNKKKHQEQQKKSAIQQALASVEGSQAKRIKFSDSEDEQLVEKEKKQLERQQIKKDLFDDDAEQDEDEGEEVLLPQYSSKKGERLVEMQSKQSLDPRFRITGTFVGDEEGEEMEAEQKAEPKETERNWQMGILEQVIGRKIDKIDAKDSRKASKNKKMLRFDPAKEEHQKLVRIKSEKESKDQATPLQLAPTTAAAAPVSQNAFYVVTDTLKEALKTRGEGFSLLDMFGSSHDEALAQRQDQLEKLNHEKILVNKSNKLGLNTVNPFSYDSSDSEEEAEQKQPEKEELEVKENDAPAKKAGKQKQKKPQIFMESFFIPKQDARLKEGAKFFKSIREELENDSYDIVKKRLKFMITKKIAKTQKNMPEKKIKKIKNKRAK